jgi:hypothetical protein
MPSFSWIGRPSGKCRISNFWLYSLAKRASFRPLPILLPQEHLELALKGALGNIAGLESAAPSQLDGSNRNVQSRTNIGIGGLFDAGNVGLGDGAGPDAAAIPQLCRKIHLWHTTVQPAAGIDDVMGTYATAINIHNPQTITVPFVKKFVVAEEEGAKEGGGTIFHLPGLMHETLQPDAVLFVGCAEIYKQTKMSPTSHIDGFVVLQIPPVKVPPFPPGQLVQPDLDVVGQYTARSTRPNPTEDAVSVDIVTYSAKLINF